MQAPSFDVERMIFLLMDRFPPQPDFKYAGTGRRRALDFGQQESGNKQMTNR
jgi:hypothetical protein